MKTTMAFLDHPATVTRCRMKSGARARNGGVRGLRMNGRMAGASRPACLFGIPTSRVLFLVLVLGNSIDLRGHRPDSMFAESR